MYCTLGTDNVSQTKQILVLWVAVLSHVYESALQLHSFCTARLYAKMRL